MVFIVEWYIAIFILEFVFLIISQELPCSSQKKKKVFLISSGILLTLFAGLRADSVGADTLAYKLWFKDFNQLDWECSLAYMDVENGYVLFNLLLGVITNEAQIVIFVSSMFINTSLLYYIYKHSNNVYVSTILFLGLNHYFTSMNTYRFYLALAVVVWAYDYLMQKKYIKSLFFMLGGFLFHRLIIVYSLSLVLAYILRRKKGNLIKAIIIEILTALMVVVVIQEVISLYPKYALYLYDVHLQEDLGSGLLNSFFIIIDVLMMFYMLKNKKHETEEKNIYIVMLSVLVFFRIVGDTIPRGFRLVQTLDYIVVIIIPYLIQYKRKYKMISNSVVYIVSFVMYVYYLINNAAEIVPYAFCFQ